LRVKNTTSNPLLALHRVGVLCGLAAGAWLGGAEAPTKLVSASLSPLSVSLCMVAGVFVARWTVPSVLQGSDALVADFQRTKHLIVWAVLAGALWAVANTLTIFAVRDVGLTIAFPLWNTNCLVGIFWGWLLFRELHGAPAKNYVKVLGGAAAILLAAFMLAWSSMETAVSATRVQALQGIVAALGASLVWGTMYVPYRKAYLSGMNPLSFVTVFTAGELGTMVLLAATSHGGIRLIMLQLRFARHQLFWLFLGGFCWVVGDLFQQYATKYIGIGRAIPLSNTNQLWGLAWGTLVFGELGAAKPASRWAVVAGSFIMLLGTLAISTSAAGADELRSTNRAILRECDRYSLNYQRVLASQTGHHVGASSVGGRRWWDYGILVVAIAVFGWLANGVVRPAVPMSPIWSSILVALLVLILLAGGWWLRKKA
jgi:drug/metabolite transporter (DMT)-like permease